MKYNDYQQIADILYCWEHPYNKNNTKKKEEQYIHYTTLNGFKAIFEKYVEQDENYITLFPSQVQFLNDAQEYQDGINIISSNNQLTQINENNVFAVCFCGEEDLLSQWKHYGKNCGIAIEFDFKEELRFKWWDLNDNNIDDTDDCFFLKPYPVLYYNKKANYRKLCKQNKNAYIDERMLAISFIPYCKNITFKEEKESRIIFFPINYNRNGKDVETKIKYRITEDKIIPQFECRLYNSNPNLNQKNDDNDSTPPIPIKNIMVGPGHNQLVVFNGVINMLEKGNIFDFIDEHKIKEIKSNPKKVYTIKNLHKIQKGELCIVSKNEKEGLNYVTYKTNIGITVQMSATPFRS